MCGVFAKELAYGRMNKPAIEWNSSNCYVVVMLFRGSDKRCVIKKAIRGPVQVGII
jgi:hypothetical protein